MGLLRNLLRGMAGRVRVRPLIPLRVAAGAEGLQGVPEAAHAAIGLYNHGAYRDAERALSKLASTTATRPAILLALLGLCQSAASRKGIAARTFREARRSDPALAGNLVSAAESLKRRGYGLSAVTAYVIASELEPGDPSIPLAAAMQMYDMGLGDAGSAWLIARGPGGDALRLFSLLSMLPGIHGSGEELRDLLAVFERDLSQLESAPLSIAAPLHEVGITSFYLAYAGINERPIQERLARLFLKASPGLAHQAAHCNPAHRRSPGLTRVGFLSRFFTRHSVGHYYMELVRALAARREFEVHVISVDGAVGASFRAEAARRGAYLDVPLQIDAARAAIARLELDVLVYADIGLHPFSYFLAFSRLAPLQCVLPGHPATTGIPTIDWFISGRQLESEAGDSFYSEKLIRLENAPLAFPQPPVIDSLPGRAGLGLNSDAHLYICPMRLQKLHPDFDRALLGILAGDPRAEILLFEDPVTGEWGRRLRERFRRSLGRSATRVRFLPWAELHELRKIVNVADVSLDTFYFGGGVTSHFVLDMGCPIVTWPSPYLRGRSTYACYAKMGIYDCVASDPEDYVRVALRIGCDPELRADVRRRIMAAKDVLFGNTGAADDLAQLFLGGTQERAQDI